MKEQAPLHFDLSSAQVLLPEQKQITIFTCNQRKILYISVLVQRHWQMLLLLHIFFHHTTTYKYTYTSSAKKHASIKTIVQMRDTFGSEITCLLEFV